MGVRRRMMGRRGRNRHHRATADSATRRRHRHRVRPIGSATAVPGPFLAGALSLGRTAARRRVVLLQLFIVLAQQRLELHQHVRDVLQHSHRRLFRVVRSQPAVLPQHGYLLTAIVRGENDVLDIRDILKQQWGGAGF